MTTCNLPQRITVEETAAPPEMPATSLEIPGAVLEINVMLYEHEKAGVRFETWPPAITSRIELIVREWLASNPTRELRAVTTGIAGAGARRNAVMLLHHAPKAEKPKG